MPERLLMLVVRLLLKMSIYVYTVTVSLSFVLFVPEEACEG